MNTKPQYTIMYRRCPMLWLYYSKTGSVGLFNTDVPVTSILLGRFGWAGSFRYVRACAFAYTTYDSCTCEAVHNAEVHSDYCKIMLAR